MTGVQVAFLIATFHVAGAPTSERSEGCVQQPLGLAPPSPMSLMIAVGPAQSDEGIPGGNPLALSRQKDANDMNAWTGRPVPPGTATADALSMEAIRMEIRHRLLFFKSCADAARRRGVADVRRLSVTWSIAPDGSIRAMKLEGMIDPEMAGCLARVGSRRFPIAPGRELSVPVPFVFVR